MTRRLILVISLASALFSLQACAPQVSLLPISRASMPPPSESPVVVCTASMMASVPARPPLPTDADFPAPTTPAASAKVQTYLTWLHSLSVLTNSLIQRATDTQSFCMTHQPKP